jgi:hypothetical protein
VLDIGYLWLQSFVEVHASVGAMPTAFLLLWFISYDISKIHLDLFVLYITIYLVSYCEHYGGVGFALALK